MTTDNRDSNKSSSVKKPISVGGLYKQKQNKQNKVNYYPPGINAFTYGSGSPQIGRGELYDPSPRKTNLDVKSIIKTPKTNGKVTSSGVEFNLSPHAWSLPLDPSVLDGRTKITADHSDRRGKMWLFTDIQRNITTRVGKTSGSNTENEVTKSDQYGLYRQQSLDKAAKEFGKDNPNTIIAAKSYSPAGFQFLWNPESINLQVSTTTEIVPDAGDRFKSIAGIFPSQEHLTFSLLLDRTNDFACVYREFNKDQDIASVANKFKGYYNTGFNQEIGTPFAQKLNQLMEYGTMHDVEYIFKMINGGTVFDVLQPSNPLGRKTFDLGYLYPALTAVEFGPNNRNLKPLSYVGWLQSVSIKHTMFNTNMIPLRTEISFDLWIYTGFGQVDDVDK